MRKGSNRSMLFKSFRSSILSTYPVQLKSLMLLALGYTGEESTYSTKRASSSCVVILYGLDYLINNQNQSLSIN